MICKQKVVFLMTSHFRNLAKRGKILRCNANISPLLTGCTVLLIHELYKTYVARFADVCSIICIYTIYESKWSIVFIPSIFEQFHISIMISTNDIDTKSTLKVHSRFLKSYVHNYVNVNTDCVIRWWQYTGHMCVPLTWLVTGKSVVECSFTQCWRELLFINVKSSECGVPWNCIGDLSVQGLASLPATFL